jgi:phosphocarrier protein HPr
MLWGCLGPAQWPLYFGKVRIIRLKAIGMIHAQITIINKLGLHARAAAKLVGVTGKHGCQIEIGSEGKMVDAKSIMSVMLLAAAQGTVLDLKVNGEGAQHAFDEVTQLVNNFFDEGE